MTAVLGFAQILAFDQSLAAEHREFVREIDAAGRALLDMINDLVGVPRE
jgi:signal transduction histidine kinase